MIPTVAQQPAVTTGSGFSYFPDRIRAAGSLFSTSHLQSPRPQQAARKEAQVADPLGE